MQVRLGIIGLGNIGQEHVKLINSGAVPELAVSAVCARSMPAIDWDIPYFSDYLTLFDSGLIDAVLIATPTHEHFAMAQAALQRGLHVLVEKPLAMSIGQAKDLLSNANSVVFGVMLNQRYHPLYQRIQALLNNGELGELVRYSWTMTAWYRPDIYYKVSAWRGTWAGEGGGLLLNQCIHNLDVLQWCVGLPTEVTAQIGFGKFHDIEVEDEVSALFRHDNGVTGSLIASSGEAPGINQFDLVCDRGMIRCDGETLTVWKGNESTAAHSKHTRAMFGTPEFSPSVYEPSATSPQHAYPLNDFARAILSGSPMHTPASEGLGSLHLANALLMSGWHHQSVSLPLSASVYEQALQQRMRESSLRAPEKLNVEIDMNKSYR